MQPQPTVFVVLWFKMIDLKNEWLEQFRIIFKTIRSVETAGWVRHRNFVLLDMVSVFFYVVDSDI